MRRFVHLFVIVLCVPMPSKSALAQTVPSGFSVIEINTSLDSDAVAFAVLPDGRILVANQNSGELQLIVNGTIVSPALMTVPNLRNAGNEQGFLGLAVDPAWPDENFIYTFHTTLDDSNRVSRYEVTGTLSDGGSDDLVVDTANPDTLIAMVDLASNHNGGTLRFGSDRTLYVSFGDDAARSQVQDLTTLHGKILRISPEPGGTLPSPNPVFPSAPPDALDEIFSIGLRNPFRFNIDPQTDALVIGDVGQNAIEEVDMSVGGENFGWPRWEGTQLFMPGQSLIPPDPTFPIYEYPQASGPNSVIALLTYRQVDFPHDNSFPPQYEGSHFFADFYHGPIYHLHQEPGGDWTATSFATGFSNPVDAAMADDGGFYVLEYGQSIRKIVYEPGPAVTVLASVFLEGPYNGGQMDTTLKFNGQIPLDQPYANPVYDGTAIEHDSAVSVGQIPAGVTDWVLVSLRTTPSPLSEVQQQVAFLNFEGDLLGIDGETGVTFFGVDSTTYYVVVRHRNHGSVMSAAPVDFATGTGYHDFTYSLLSAYTDSGPPMVELSDGRFGMFSGDSNADGLYTVIDYNEWFGENESTEIGYRRPDFDLDGEVQSSDYDMWYPNTVTAAASQVPD